MILEEVRTVLEDVLLVLLTIFFTLITDLYHLLRHLNQHEQLRMRAFCLTRHQFSLKHLHWLHQEILTHPPPSI